MTCREVQEQLSPWLDGELTGEAQARVQEHLRACASCRRELARLETLDGALAQVSVPAPAGLAEKVLARIQPPRRRRWWQTLALAASLVVGVALGGALVHDMYSLAGAVDSTNSGEVAALADFHDFPQGSLGTVLASYQPDDANGNGL
jgi:predicted anti-sigma-YlaC factor YlaD